MGATSLDREFVAASYGRPLRARPLGALAACGMGAGATFVLALALVLTRHPAEIEAGVAATDSISPAKIAMKAIFAVPERPTATKPKLFSAFDLKAPEFEAEKKTVAVREADEGGGRVDSLTIGQFALGAPFLRLDVHQQMTGKETNPDFFLDMTRHAAQAGLNVAKIGQPTALATRFGAFETADIRLAAPAGEGAAASQRSCLATRFVESKLSLEIAGLACGSAAKPIERAALGCILDGLDYVAAGDNKGLNEFFLKAEIARGKGCANISHEDVTASIPAHKAAAHAKPARPHKGHATR